MGKTLKYVSEFTFPSDKGYSGSAGKQMVKGYARGGSCGYAKGGMKPMKKADGGRVDDPRRPMIDRTIPELIDAINRERAMEMADRMAAERVMELVRPSRRISQGLRSPRAEMARERALMGDDIGYKKGGMAMRKQYPTNNGKPMISGPKAAPAPKADMLYSKKEVNAKNLLRDGKAPSLPHAKGSVNMKKGGPVKKAMGGAMPPGASGGALPPGVKDNSPDPQTAIDRKYVAATQAKMAPPGQPQGQMPPPGQPQTQGQRPPSGLLQVQNPMRQPMGNVQAPPKGSEAYRMYERAVPRHYRQQIESGQMTQQQMSKIMQSPMMQKRMQYESKYTGPMGPQRPEVQQPNPRSPTRPGPQVEPAPIDTRTTPPQMATYKKGGQTKVGKVMGEFKEGKLHSGSKSGPVVKSRKQAIAIGLSEARKAKK